MNPSNILRYHLDFNNVMLPARARRQQLFVKTLVMARLLLLLSHLTEKDVFSRLNATFIGCVSNRRKYTFKGNGRATNTRNSMKTSAFYGFGFWFLIQENENSVVQHRSFWASKPRRNHQSASSHKYCHSIRRNCIVVRAKQQKKERMNASHSV